MPLQLHILYTHHHTCGPPPECRQPAGLQEAREGVVKAGQQLADGAVGLTPVDHGLALKVALTLLHVYTGRTHIMWLWVGLAKRG